MVPFTEIDEVYERLPVKRVVGMSALFGLLLHSSFPTHWGILADVDPPLSSQIQLSLATPLVSGWLWMPKHSLAQAVPAA